MDIEEMKKQRDELTRQIEKAEAEKAEKDKAQRHYSGVIAAPLWEDFVAINRARGMSNNSSLNQLITGYIRDNREYLEG